MNKKKKWKKWLWLILPILIIGFFIYNKNQKNSKIDYSTLAVKKGSLLQSVSETGSVKPNKDLELNFPQSGKISKILVKIGDKVQRDQILAELDNSSLAIKEREAQSNLEVAKANRNKLTSGATSSDIAVMSAQVKQAKTAYDNANNDYVKLQKTIAENIAQAEKKLADLVSSDMNIQTSLKQSVNIAKLNLENGKASYQQAINNAQDSFLITADYKMALASTALDNMNRIITDENIGPVYSVNAISYKESSKEKYALAIALKKAVQNSLDLAKKDSSTNNIDNLNKDLSDYLNKVYQALSDCYGALENSITSTNFTQTTLDNYKNTISSQLSSVNSGISALQSAKSALDNANLSYRTNIASLTEAVKQAEVALSDGITSAQNSLATLKVNSDQQMASAQSGILSAQESWSVAQKQLDKLKAPARQEDINLAEAQVRQAEASLQLIQQQKEETLLKAPIDGQVVALNYEVGEQFSAAKAFLKLLTENNFEIDIDISEADISKISVNNTATITFDAFSEEQKFIGKVFSIEPAATVLQGVIYYKTKIELQAPEDTEKQKLFFAIKPEMTANVTINTNKKDDVLIIPSRAVIDRNGQGKFVRILNNGQIRETKVTLGLYGDEGMVEVLSGDLKEGDLVVTSVKDPSKPLQ